MFPRLTKDPWGRQLLLTKAGWVHVVGKHRDMWPWKEAALAAVPTPDVITPDPIDGRWQYWAWGVVHSRWLFVVVDWRGRQPHIVTAFAKRKGPRWPQPAD